MARLSRRLICGTAESEAEGFMVRQYMELVPLDVAAEVGYSPKNAEQLPVEGGVLLLGVGQFTREECNRFPSVGVELFQARAHCNLGGINCDTGLGPGRRVV